MDEELQKLREWQSRAITKKGKEDTASMSVAFSASGNNFFGSSVDSDSHLLNFTSEQVVLSEAKNQNDLEISKVRTLLGKENNQGSSLISMKILADYSSRVGRPLEYELYDSNGKNIFTTKDIAEYVKEKFPYHPKFSVLKDRIKVEPSSNVVNMSDEPIEEQLRNYAKQGALRNLPSYDTASGYGASVLLSNKKIVFGGQYSSYDDRLGMHAEMSVVLDALMRFPQEKISALGVVSTKHLNEACFICGACLQFLAEISNRFKFDITFYCFAYNDAAETHESKLQELLLYRWTSKNW